MEKLYQQLHAIHNQYLPELETLNSIRKLCPSLALDSVIKEIHKEYVLKLNKVRAEYDTNMFLAKINYK